MLQYQFEKLGFYRELQRLGIYCVQIQVVFSGEEKILSQRPDYIFVRRDSGILLRSNGKKNNLRQVYSYSRLNVVFVGFLLFIVRRLGRSFLETLLVDAHVCETNHFGGTDRCTILGGTGRCTILGDSNGGWASSGRGGVGRRGGLAEMDGGVGGVIVDRCGGGCCRGFGEVPPARLVLLLNRCFSLRGGELFTVCQQTLSCVCGGCMHEEFWRRCMREMFAPPRPRQRGVGGGLVSLEAQTVGSFVFSRGRRRSNSRRKSGSESHEQCR